MHTYMRKECLFTWQISKFHWAPCCAFMYICGFVLGCIVLSMADWWMCVCSMWCMRWWIYMYEHARTQSLSRWASLSLSLSFTYAEQVDSYEYMWSSLSSSSSSSVLIPHLPLLVRVWDIDDDRFFFLFLRLFLQKTKLQWTAAAATVTVALASMRPERWLEVWSIANHSLRYQNLYEPANYFVSMHVLNQICLYTKHTDSDFECERRNRLHALQTLQSSFFVSNICLYIASISSITWFEKMRESEKIVSTHAMSYFFGGGSNQWSARSYERWS